MSIPLHILKMSQKKRILELLKIRGLAGVFVWELTGARPEGLGCQQYNARILELRKDGHNIINTTPGHFILENINTRTQSTEEDFKEITPKDLTGDAQKNWLALGAYLRGEGPKPETRESFEETIQQALM